MSDIGGYIVVASIILAAGFCIGLHAVAEAIKQASVRYTNAMVEVAKINKQVIEPLKKSA
jgi:hypothetical protein